MDLFRAANEGKTKANSLADSSQLSSSLLIIAYCLGVDHSLYLEFRVHCIYARGPERVVRPAPMQSHWKHINGESGFLPVALPLPLYPPACLSSCLFVLSQPTSFSLLFVFSLDQQYLDRFYFSTSEPTARLWAMCLRLCLCACVSAYRLSVCSLKSVQVLLRSLLVFRFYPSLLLSSALPLFIYLLSTLDTLLDARSLSLSISLSLCLSFFLLLSLSLSSSPSLCLSLHFSYILSLFFCPLNPHRLSISVPPYTSVNSFLCPSIRDSLPFLPSLPRSTPTSLRHYHPRGAALRRLKSVGRRPNGPSLWQKASEYKKSHARQGRRHAENETDAANPRDGYKETPIKNGWRRPLSGCLLTHSHSS